MKLTPLIILSGKAGSGKDTVAGMLASYGMQPIAMADPMKRMAQLLFGFTDDQLWGSSESRNAPVGIDRDIFTKNFENPLSNQAINVQLDTMLQGLIGDPVAAWPTFKAWYKGVCIHALELNGITPRYVLQTLGTEFGRAYNENMWVDGAKRTAFKLLAGGHAYTKEKGLVRAGEIVPPTFVVITDGRFRNELLAVLAVAGETVKITRKTDEAATARAGVLGHSSEKELLGIPENFYTHSIENNGTLKELEARVNGLYHRLCDRTSPIL
jgi:hypothetical protein